jgi:putative membrane protein
MLGSSNIHNLGFAAALGALATVGMMGCGSDNNNTTTTGPKTTEGQTTQIVNSIKSDSNIFAVLHWSDVGEINAGRVAAMSGSDTAVRNFANQMVLDHGTLDSTAFQLSQQLSIKAALSDSTLPQAVMAEQDTLQNLARNPTPDSTAASGDSTTVPPPSAFDRTYIAGQVADHVRTLAIIDASMKVVQNQTLKDMLQNTVRPMIVMHLQSAQAIQSRIGSPTS